MPPVLLFSFMPEMDRAMEECRREMIRKDTALPVIVFWHMAILLCLWLSLGAGITASAAENGQEQENGMEQENGAEQENGSEQENGADIVMIRVEGKLEEPDRDALLERINAIRREACEEGIDNPVNGVPLTAADYVPLQWSYELEEIAVLRAAESTILQDHIRPDGRECFTAAPEGVSYTMETLAWGFGSAAEAVEGWYSEKSSYVEADGRPAGHYMALINPENRFVGIAELKQQWQRDACAGVFGERAFEGEHDAAGEPAAGERGSDGDGMPDSAADSGGDKVWMIPLKSEFLPSVIERALEITAGRIFRAAVRVMSFVPEQQS